MSHRYWTEADWPTCLRHGDWNSGYGIWELCFIEIACWTKDQIKLSIRPWDLTACDWEQASWTCEKRILTFRSWDLTACDWEQANWICGEQRILEFRPWYLIAWDRETDCWTCEQRILEFRPWELECLRISAYHEIGLSVTKSRQAGPVSREYWSLSMRFDCLWLRAGKLDLWAENTGV